MAITLDALLKVGASIQGIENIRALSAALKQVTEETRQMIALQKAQTNVARVLLDNQIAAAKTDRERAALAAQRLQLGLKASESEYAATTKQLAAQKQLQAEQVKAAADRLRVADATMKQALVVTNAMRSEKLAAEENLQVQIQKARAQYQSINNLKQIAQLERQAAIAAAEGADAANRRAMAAANKARMDAQTFAAFRDMDRETQRRQTEAARAQAASQQQMLAGMQSVKNMALSAAGALGAFSAVQVGRNIIEAGQEAELTRRRIAAVAGALGETAGVYEIAARGADQFAIANIDSQIAVANLYNRLRPMGVSLQQIETVYTGVNKAVLLGGLSAYDATEAFRQLGQAMGSGRLQGDELRSLMERMPAIGVALAKVMGVSVGEIKKLGSEGKITTDIIVKATEELAKLQPPEPTSVQRYTAAVKDLSTALGEELLPQITPAIEGLTSLVKGFADNVEHIMDVLALPAIGLSKIFAILSRLPTPVFSNFQPKELAAELQKIDEIAARLKVNSVNRKLAEEGAATAAGEYNAAAAAAAASAAAAAKSASEKAAAEAAAKEAKERQAELEKEMLEAQRQAVAYLEVQFQQVEQINNLAAAKAERMRDIAQETLSVEQAQIDVARAILDGKMNMATSDEERLAITRELAELDKRAAQANYAAAMAQIEAEKQLEEIRVINAENNFRRARAAYDIAVKLGTLTNEITAKLETARGELKVSAVQNVAFDRSIAAKTTVADTNLEAATIRADNAITRLMGNVDNRQPSFYLETPQGRIPQYFAMGGHVKGPTLAVIGEGGEGESVVPDSKRVGFAMNVLSGITGAAAIPKFATGGYVGSIPNYGNSLYPMMTKSINNDSNYNQEQDLARIIKNREANDANTQNRQRAASANQKGRIYVTAGTRINRMSAADFFSPSNQWSRMIRQQNPEGYAPGGSPISKIATPRITVNTSINAQPVAPDMFLIEGSAIRQMAWDIANQAIGNNNAKQRQPSARRRSGRR